MSIVENRLEALKRRLEILDYIDWTGENPHREDEQFIAELKKKLASEELSLDDVANLREPYLIKAAEAQKKKFDRILRQRTNGSHNRLFAVGNKSQMWIDVIAMDSDTAAEFAAQRGHVRDPSNATVTRYGDEHIEKLVNDGSALGRAVRAGVPGVVEKRGKNVVVGEAVFTPFTVV